MIMGRGRPPIPDHLKRVRCSGMFRMQKWIVDWLRIRKDAGRLIEQALVKHYGLNPPERGDHEDEET